MHATLQLLESTDFPAIRHKRPDTLQVNLGYRCNRAYPVVSQTHYR
ncbi:hypothetical protein BH20PSE1_BH20PSE1_04440 [soil metagenome]